MAKLIFESVPIEETREPLVNLRTTKLILEPMYFKQGVAPTDEIYLRQGVITKLQAVQKHFGDTYLLKIWDGYRPRNIQNAIYDSYYQSIAQAHPSWSSKQISDETEKFVTKASDINRIPPHATGGAVDITLVDIAQQELDMGTKFDFFGPEANSFFYERGDKNETVGRNRRLLREAMLAEDFTYDDDEWWHFDYGNQIWAKNAKKPAALYGESQVKSR